MVEQLEEVSVSYAARVVAFVLMSNHFHLLIETPLQNLNEIMNYFMRETSRAIAKQAFRINHVYGGRYKSSLITHKTYFAHAYKYVYRNPVQAQIADCVENYPYSTLQWITNKDPYRFPVYDLSHDLAGSVPNPIKDRLTWLNEPYLIDENMLIRKALRRVEFSFSKGRNQRQLVQSLMYEKEVGTF